MVIFNDLLRIPKLMQSEMVFFLFPPKLKVFQAVAQAEWEAPPLIKVSQCKIYTARWNIKFHRLSRSPSIIGQVEYRQFDPGLYVKQFIVQVEYQEIPPLTCRRKFPVPDARTAWQSQAGRRQFPVVQ